jgi:A/G-specific adenine glycosylase
MLETPSTPWDENAPTGKAIADHAPVEAAWDEVPGLVEHTFTHFHLELAVYRAEVGEDAALLKAAEPERCLWLHARDLAGAALPSLMRKVIAHALPATGRARTGERASSARPRANRRSA